MFDELFTYDWDSSVRKVDTALLLDYMENVFDPSADSQQWFAEIREFAGRHNYAVDKKAYKKNPEEYAGLFSDVCEMLRYVVSTQTRTMDLCSILKVLGKDRVLERIHRYQEKVGGAQ